MSAVTCDLPCRPQTARRPSTPNHRELGRRGRQIGWAQRARSDDGFVEGGARSAES